MGSADRINDAALWAVTCRAREARRPDRVLHDPFAAHLGADRGEELFGAEADSLASIVVTVTAAAIDRILQHAVTDLHIHTVAHLGAGLDTRPYRLELPSDLHWIEADLEPLLGYKVLRLAHASPYCHIRRVNVDLTDAEARRQGVRDIADDVTRGLILTEGLATLLGREALDDLIAIVPAVFKWWVVDTIAPASYALAIHATGEHHRTTSLLSPQEILHAFERGRWRALEFRPLTEPVLRCADARTARLDAALAPGELEGIWLFQRPF